MAYNHFEPIAIVGEGCILPSVNSVEDLWRVTSAGLDLTSNASINHWGVDPQRVVGEQAQITSPGDTAWSARGGFVDDAIALSNFDSLNLSSENLQQTSRGVQWCITAVRQAMASAAISPEKKARTDWGVILGNLSYAPRETNDLFAQHWLTKQPEYAALHKRLFNRQADYSQRFSSSAPSQIVAQAIGAAGPTFCLDAACASSLYAIKLACDYLHSGRATTMFTGAVNHADSLYLNVGFSALKALSKNGISRPFDSRADGLVPAEGAAIVILKTLRQARKDGDTIRGVIRSIGLSNDGRTGGLLSPSRAGQIRAYENAYKHCDIKPNKVSYIECHATGTPTGDSVELESINTFFSTNTGLVISSLKSNFGHLITAAGAAGLIRVLQNMKQSTSVASIHCEQPIAGLHSGPARLVQKNEHWANGDNCIAGINAFGFGGNNAHMVVQHQLNNKLWLVPKSIDTSTSSPQSKTNSTVLESDPLVVCGVSLRTARVESKLDFVKKWSREKYGLNSANIGSDVKNNRINKLDIDLAQLGFPPSDLDDTSAQQLLIMTLIREALGELPAYDAKRTGVYVGMGVDMNSCRFTMRTRLAHWLGELASIEGRVDEHWLPETRNSITRPINAVSVIGTMPNIPANRSNLQLDLQGPSFTVSAEEYSGSYALDIAKVALLKNEIDLAVVGAVDISSEEIHRQAVALRDQQANPKEYSVSAQLPVEQQVDGGVVMLLQRKSTALKAGNPIYYELPLDETQNIAKERTAELCIAKNDWLNTWSNILGAPHTAINLMGLAAESVLTHYLLARGQSETGTGYETETETEKKAEQENSLPILHKEQLAFFQGATLQELINNVQAAQPAELGCLQANQPWRLVIVLASPNHFTELQKNAAEALGKFSTVSKAPVGVINLAKNIYLSCEKLAGDVGFVFTGAASAYPGMGNALCSIFPTAVEQTLHKHPVFASCLPWLQAEAKQVEGPFDVLQGCSLLSQIHACITQNILGVKPQAMLGVSSGETNSMFAAGVWRDMGALFDDIDRSGMYTQWIAGDLDCARKYYNNPTICNWLMLRVVAPVEKVKALLREHKDITLTMINSNNDCVVAGEASCVNAIKAALNSFARAVVPMGHDIVAHHPALSTWQDTWYQIHNRETFIDESRGRLPRFYSNAFAANYSLSQQKIAQALTQQAVAPVDFRPVVEAAYSDGVSIFIEHGPRHTSSQWIAEQLGERPHLAVHLDRFGAGALPSFEAVAQLWCAGVELNQTLLAGLAHSGSAKAPSYSKSLPVHLPAIVFPSLEKFTSAGSDKTTVSSSKQLQIRATQPYWQDTKMAPAPLLPDAITSIGVSKPQQGLKDNIKGDSHTVQLKQILAAFPQPDYSGKNSRLPFSLPVALPVQLPIQLPLSSTAEAIAPLPRAIDLSEDKNENKNRAVQAPMHSGTAAQSVDQTQHSAAIRALKSLHTQLSENHNQYLAFQNKAAEVLLQAKLSASVAQGNAHVGEQRSVQNSFKSPIKSQIKISEQKRSNASSAIHAKPASITPLTNEPAQRKQSDVAATSSGYKKITSEFPGPKYNRAQLEELAGGIISNIFGPLFKQQDNYARQVRMPQPPLLLADRVLGIDATPGAMESRGSIWTETDVTSKDWYVHHGHMPAGIMIEAGQADLLLISWMGADFENKGERVYRLLGCELTYRDKLPAVGDTIRYDIHLDGYAKQGDVRLFFFHYNCEINGHTHLEVRRGQAGFFTYEELAGSAGVIWDAEKEKANTALNLADGPCHTTKTAFTRADIDAYTQGDLVSCFGDSFYRANCHQRTPTIVGGDLLMFDEVLELNHRGGPWQRGYLKAQLNVKPDHWFFDGHFKNDPCAPGTLMLEGGVQVISFYLASMGFTLARDGWRFEPIKDETFNLICRSQLIPGGKKLVYEIYVHGVEATPKPQIRVDLMCTVDGRKAFLGQGVGVELVPGWPCESREHVIEHADPVNQADSSVAVEQEFKFDEDSMVACAWGKPSDAFGPHYKQFDGPRRGPRLPGYPYHFISKVKSVDIAPRQLKAGGKAVMEYLIPNDAWYFSENSQATMPFPVLLEAALQPCGWLATYMGGGFGGDTEAFFRNLDGTATQYREIVAEDTCLLTEVESTSVSAMAGMIILGFNVRCYIQAELVYQMETVFGFFPEAALAQQAGLSTTEQELCALNSAEHNAYNLRHRPVDYFNGQLRLPGPMLCLIDRITGVWPDGGQPKLGRVRSQMSVNTNAWFFKSHFYGDPVQPGSLGLEMMLQTLQCYAISQNLGEQFVKPRFETLASNIAHSWSYRGQVLPHNKIVECDLEVQQCEHESGRIVITADASLWVDKQKIYQAKNISLAVIDESKAAKLLMPPERIFDSQSQHWINDHCPTFTVPALPFMVLANTMVEDAAKRLPGRKMTGLENVRVNSWVSFNNPKQTLHSWGVAHTAHRVAMELTQWDEPTSRYKKIAHGDVLFDEQYPFPVKLLPPLPSTDPVLLAGNPYADKGGWLFHGSAFQAVSNVVITAKGASGKIDIKAIGVPAGKLHPGVLDASLHIVPHHMLDMWFPTVEQGSAAYPLLLKRATFFSDTPKSGELLVEARPVGLDDVLKLPTIKIQITTVAGVLWAEFILVEAVLPKGPLGELSSEAQLQFFVAKQPVPGARLSTINENSASLALEVVNQCNWLPGTLESIYDCNANIMRRTGLTLTEVILAKEYLAAQWHIHPAQVDLAMQGELLVGLNKSDCLSMQQLTIACTGATPNVNTYNVTSKYAQANAGLLFIRDYWRASISANGGLVEDIFMAIAHRFTGTIKNNNICSGKLIQAQRDSKPKGVLYLANHQVGVESVLFAIAMSALNGMPVSALAKKEHAHSWIGNMLTALAPFNAKNLLTLINRENPTAVLQVMGKAMQAVAMGEHSLLVHIAGTRSLAAREAQTTISSSLIDAAIKAGVDIVPVLFHGGLPIEPAKQRLEFPLGMAKQDWTLGRAIPAHILANLNSAEQKQYVLNALNGLDDILVNEQPNKPQVEFEKQVASISNCTHEQAVIYQCLQHSPFALSNHGQALMAAVNGQRAWNLESEQDRALKNVADLVLGRS
ncbi:polyketide synthase dehydratase domain-containing protein [Saccharophagus degradans]|uniref:beta-ketoacyl synthase N-terminal-like domain-containing protein n=1 Tax=Saccharophagus degradans TaxID=86304 RepID=UPI001C0A5638|nr:beta-ketoacyl synthase N-terminal-like domain-containing protein [Saccharophagus degradans]MBU2983761.1 polyketide synthase dehydratase domain-containing protein [Saccharophagus degradans]